MGSMYQLGYQPSNILSVYNRLSYEEYPIFGPVIYAPTAIIFYFIPCLDFWQIIDLDDIIRSLQVLLVSFILGWLCLVTIGNLTIASVIDRFLWISISFYLIIHPSNFKICWF